MITPEELSKAIALSQSLVAVIAQASERLHTVSNLIATAQAENRKWTESEWSQITQPAEIALANLQQSIAVAKNPNTVAPPPTTVTETTVKYPVQSAPGT